MGSQCPTSSWKTVGKAERLNPPKARKHLSSTRKPGRIQVGGGQPPTVGNGAKVVGAGKAERLNPRCLRQSSTVGSRRRIKKGGGEHPSDPDTHTYYHGTHAHNVPHILEKGFQPCMGAGSEQLSYHYGVPTPGVYVADSFIGAATYPIYPTAGPVKVRNIKKLQDISGGSYISHDGTPPLRVVFRLKARRSDRIWKRDRQSQFMPADLYISHVCVNALRP